MATAFSRRDVLRIGVAGNCGDASLLGREHVGVGHAPLRGGGEASHPRGHRPRGHAPVNFASPRKTSTP